jgi:hypothetical protein
VADANVSQPLGKLKIVGWITGFAFSVVFPKLTAPMSLSMMFDLGGAFSGMLGFAGMVWLFSKRNVTGKRKFLAALGALVAALITGGIYRRLLLAPENATPDTGIMIFELVLYCIACFCFAAVLSYAYWYGGPQVVKMFNKNPAVGGG